MRFTFIILMSAIVAMTACGKNTTGPDAISTIMTRASVRSFTGAPVPKDTLDVLVKAGMAAPTAMDRRPWEFIVITDGDVLKKLAEALPYAKMTAKAGAAIVVCGDTRRQFGDPHGPMWIMDCSAASQNILLAAHAKGLGAVWTALYPVEGNVRVVREILAIPDHVVPLNLIPVGIPAGDTKPKDKFDPSRIHNDRW